MTEQWEVVHIFGANNVRTPKKSFDLDRLIPVGPGKEDCLGWGDSAQVKEDSQANKASQLGAKGGPQASQAIIEVRTPG